MAALSQTFFALGVIMVLLVFAVDLGLWGMLSKGSHLFAKTVRQALATLSERHTGVKVVLKDLPMP